MGKSFEMSSEARRWAHNVIVAFRRECNEKGGYTTKAWEERKLLALKQWASKQAERRCVSFAWWMVDTIHSIIMFEEMNADGSASNTAVRLAGFYRGKRVPKSSNSNQFRKAVNVVWLTLRGETLSDQYSNRIEHNIACRVVFDLMMRLLEEPSTVVSTPLSRRPRTSFVHMTFAANVHDALERGEREREEKRVVITTPPNTPEVVSETKKSPVQLELQW